MRENRKVSWFQDEVCVYCGSPAVDRDHVVCLSSTGLPRSGKEIEKTAPSCAECNRLLGDVYITTVEERAAYLLPKYERRLRRALSVPDWEKEDIVEMCATMQLDIKADLRARAEARRRLEYLKLVSYGCYSDDLESE